MGTTSVSLRINDNLLSQMEKLTQSLADNRTAQFQCLINEFIFAFNEASKSLKGYFGFYEMSFLCSCFNSSLPCTTFAYKSVLMMQYDDSMEYGCNFICDKEGIDDILKNLRSKLEPLTEMQSYFVTYSIFNYWKAVSEDGADSTDILKRMTIVDAEKDC